MILNHKHFCTSNYSMGNVLNQYVLSHKARKTEFPKRQSNYDHHIMLKSPVDSL